MIIFVSSRSILGQFWLLVMIGALIVAVVRIDQKLCDPSTWQSPNTHLAAHTPATSDTANNESKKIIPPPSDDADSRALLLVQVPATAEVWLEGRQGKQTGPSRTFRTPPLEQGVEYEYEVRARWPADDRVVDRTRRVKVRASVKTEVDFTKPDAAEH